MGERLLTTEEATRYLGVAKQTFLTHRDKLDIAPVSQKRINGNTPTNLYSLDDLDKMRESICYDMAIVPITPTEDELTEYGSTIQWSKKYRKSVPSKNCPGRTLEYVPVLCRCGLSCEIYTYEFRKKSQIRLPLCTRCATAATRKYGPENGTWVSGVREHTSGYIEVHKFRLTPEEQELFAPMLRHDNYIFEHRLVMARHLGRPLTRDEHVHHKDAIKNHNEISNLQLVSPKEHWKVELSLARQEVKRLRKILEENGIPY